MPKDRGQPGSGHSRALGVAGVEVELGLVVLEEGPWLVVLEERPWLVGVLKGSGLGGEWYSSG